MTDARPSLFDDRPYVVMVTGSRGWNDPYQVFEWLRIFRPERIKVVHGGARGADLYAAEWCEANSVRCEAFLPDTAVPSPQRYHQRNDAMLDVADCVLAFWDGESRGTKSVIGKARDRSLSVTVVAPKAARVCPSGVPA